MTHIEPVIRSIPLSQLELAPENVRKTPADPAALAELKASIAAHGLLENLLARAQGPGEDGVGHYAVIAGGRRLAAMQALAGEGVLDEDQPVPCRMTGASESAGELSLAENVIRIAMHPADQVIAFHGLAQAGLTVSAIAARFGVSERLVEQRLRLGHAAPELLDAYRADEIDLETLKAFAVTMDHGRQMAVWEQVKSQGCRPGAWQVKRMLTEDQVSAASAVARFVGIEAYEAAGGAITRDLFAQEDDRGIWFDDPVLLNELAMKKLRTAADELATRWKWAEAALEADWSATAGFGRIRPEPAVPTDEEEVEQERLRTRHDELAELDDDGWTEERVEQAEAIETRLDEIHAAVEARAAFRPEDMSMAGCIATIDRDGALQVIQGLVRPEDMPETTGEGGDVQDPGDHGVGTESGRVDAPAITAPIATPADPRAKAREEAGVGIGLADDLRTIRTALIKAHLARDFEAAFDLMVFQLGRAVFTEGCRANALDIAVKETADRPAMRVNDEEFAGWSPGEAMLADRSGLSLDWLDHEDDGQAFAALRALPQAEKQALFAAAVARTVKGQLAFEPDARPELEATAARLDIDFAAHVRPTADMLWSRIRKDRILAVARETLGPAWASARSKYKKADLAKTMEGAFAAGDPPVGLAASAHAAALAWTPPGFAPFDAGPMDDPDTAGDVPPAAEGADAPAGEPDAVPQPAEAEAADGRPSIDVSEENVLTPPGVNGHDSGDGLDIPEFLRRA